MRDLDGVRQLHALVDTYTEACRRGDVDTLRTLFHPDARMYGSFDGRRGEQPISRMFERVAEAPTGDAHSCHVLAVHQTGDAASVVVAEEGYLGRDFVDHFAVTRADGEWRIVSKVYTQLG